MKTIRRLFLLCLCAALLCSAAFAETVDMLNTENREYFLDSCRLPDGSWVFAGWQGKGKNTDEIRGRILLMNPDRTMKEYLDEKIESFSDVVLTKDNTLAALHEGGVKFLTAAGEPVGELPLPAEGWLYETAFGVLRGQRSDAEHIEYAELLDWDGSVLFRINEPETMWAGRRRIYDEDGLVLCGQAAGDPATAPAKVMKIDLQGNTVWETILPRLMDEKIFSDAVAETKTGDGGYLIVQYDCTAMPEEGNMQGAVALTKLDAKGETVSVCGGSMETSLVAEYNGKYVAGDNLYDTEKEQGYVRYRWYDSEGNDPETTEYYFREEDIPPFVNRENPNWFAEKLVPMADGLWQWITFWETDDPEDEDPAYVCQDSILVRVPEL